MVVKYQDLHKMKSVLREKGIHKKIENGLTLILHKLKVDLNMNKSTLKATWSRKRKLLHIRTGGGSGDNLNQLAGNGGLALTVVQDLEPAWY